MESKKKFDAIIFDLGLSSDQLENSGRGFSFMKDEPLLMTMKENPGPEDVTAIDVVNTWSEQSLADIFYGSFFWWLGSIRRSFGIIDQTRLWCQRFRKIFTGYGRRFRCD